MAECANPEKVKADEGETRVDSLTESANSEKVKVEEGDTRVDSIVQYIVCRRDLLQVRIVICFPTLR